MCIGVEVIDENTKGQRGINDSYIAIGTKKYGDEVYRYFRRNRIPKTLQKISGKTWKEAARDLGLSIPGLFILLSHSMKAGIIKEVRIR